MEKETHNPHIVDGLKIGKYISLTFQHVRDQISQQELEKLQNKDYSKHTLNVNYPLLLKRLTTTDIKCERYWKKSFRINGDSYYLCSEWYDKHWDPFLRWSKRYKRTSD
jgi:hypothetical protein